ncbi:Interactor of constitutive active ROPs 5 [Spatholobus suberectus]|nr:Interactor of constitutive active ROPs 5 [Spatholobus suberectus]
MKLEFLCLVLSWSDQELKRNHWRELVSKLQANLLSSAKKNILGSTNENGPSQEHGENEEINQLRAELISEKTKVGQLRSTLDIAKVRYQEECFQSTLQTRSAFEQLKRTELESSQRKVELYEELKNVKVDIEEPRASLMDNES